MLTIDAGLQYKLEQIAKQSMESTKAESIMLIAAEAKSGEILSYISLPAPNLNSYSYSTAEEEWTDLNVRIRAGFRFKIFLLLHL